MHRLTTLVLTALVSAGATPLTAQRYLEIGMDAGLQRTSGFGAGQALWTFYIPVQHIRIGVPIGARSTLESRINFLHLRTGGGTATFFNGGVHGLFPFSDGPGATFYGTVGGTLNLRDVSGPNDADLTLGGGAGVRLPLDPRFGWRLEGRIDRQLDLGVNSVSLLIGLSFFTRE